MSVEERPRVPDALRPRPGVVKYVGGVSTEAEGPNSNRPAGPAVPPRRMRRLRFRLKRRGPRPPVPGSSHVHGCRHACLCRMPLAEGCVACAARRLKGEERKALLEARWARQGGDPAPQA